MIVVMGLWLHARSLTFCTFLMSIQSRPSDVYRPGSSRPSVGAADKKRLWLVADSAEKSVLSSRQDEQVEKRR